MYTLSLVRHGECEWDASARVAGWCDPDLTERGVEQARVAGERLRGGELPLVVHTSAQIRSIPSANRALAEAGRSWIPARRSWRLNECHFGALQGKTLDEVAQACGPGPTRLWERFVDSPPPASAAGDALRAIDDIRYATVSPAALPVAESFRDVEARVLPYFHDAVVPDLRVHASVVILGHEASLLAMVGQLERCSWQALRDLRLEPSTPLVYELDGDLRPAAPRRYLES